jgi:iron uptake system EfeUOB component EfeO/EfeM
MAKTLWKEHYGEKMPDIKPFGDSYKNIGLVWTMCVDLQERSVYTTTEYPPSVLDNSAVALPVEEKEKEKATTVPDKQRFAFRNQKMATLALYWWIICTIPTVRNRRKWAEDMLGEHTSAVLYTTQSPVWSILSRENNGSIWVEYNGRKCAIL